MPFSRRSVGSIDWASASHQNEQKAGTSDSHDTQPDEIRNLMAPLRTSVHNQPRRCGKPEMWQARGQPLVLLRADGKNRSQRGGAICKICQPRRYRYDTSPHVPILKNLHGRSRVDNQSPSDKVNLFTEVPHSSAYCSFSAGAVSSSCNAFVAALY